MCGIVGVAGNLFGKDINAMRELLWADAVRGFHSTGVAMIGHTKRPSIIKHPGSPMNVFADKDFSQEFNMGKRVIIGHNRYATVGDRTAENAHPFHHGAITGVHNGTLDYRARKVLTENEKFGTDSEALYYNIAHFGIEEVMAEMSGAWALVWHDYSNDSINFLRNDQRPLSYTFNENGTVMYWASEPEMLRWILLRNDIKHGPIYSTKHDVWIRFKVPKGHEKWGEPTLTEVKGYKAPPFLGEYGREMPWGDEEMWGGWSPTQGGKKMGPAMIGPGTRDESSAGKNVVWLQKQKQEEERQNGSVARPSSSNDTLMLPGLPSTKTGGMSAMEQAYMEGAEAGEKGWSISRNPYSNKTQPLLNTEWLQGRRFGLENCSAAAIKVTRKPVEFQPVNDEDRAVKGYNGEVLSVREFTNRTRGVCSWAGCDIEHNDTLKWFGRDEAVCMTCVNGDQTFLAALKA